MLAELCVQSRTQHKHSEQEPDLLRPDLMLPESVSLLEQVLFLYDFLGPAVTVAISANSSRADLDTPRMGRAGTVNVPVETLSVLHDEAAAWGRCTCWRGPPRAGRSLPARPVGGLA